MSKTKESDEWQTPQWLFDELNREFNFCLDLCASENNKKCNWYCQDYLTKGVHPRDDFDYKVDPNIEAYFMNPPYSNPYPFVAKAWEDSKYCKIVCLLKCDPSTKWWGIFWNYKRQCLSLMGGEMWSEPGPKPGCEVRFLPKRLKFEMPGRKATTAAFPSAIVIFDRRNENK